MQNSIHFEKALILAVNRGHDAWAVGAVTGQIAGRIYGYSQIPERWIEGLHQRSHLFLIAKKLRM
ncbi:MAG: ADP-ribosylglycohydrolase family protein [bacterium]